MRKLRDTFTDMLKGRGLFGAVGQIGSLTAISRVLGFARDILIAAFIGAGPIADAFFVAFKLPNLFRRMTAEGALTNAFIPAYAKARKAGEGVAASLAAEIQSSLFWALMALVVVMEITMPVVIHLIAPGFDGSMDGSGDPRYARTVHYARLTMPYLPMISLVALWAAITNAHEKFLGGAAAPIVLNLCLITGALASGLLAGVGAVPLVVAIPCAGVLQMLLMQRMLRRIHRTPRLQIFPRIGARARKMWRVFFPAALGAGSTQINLLVDQILASLLPTGSISALYYADRIAQLPLGIVGIALGVALLPRLSRLETEKNREEVIATIARAMQLALFFAIPAMLGAMILSTQIIGGLFAFGAFTADNIAPVAMVLVAYGFGIPPFILGKVLLPAFFAAGDARSPMFIAFATISLNVVLSLALMRVLGAPGLALATSLASWCALAVMVVMLVRRGRIVPSVIPKLIPAIFLSCVMAGVLLGLEAVFAAHPMPMPVAPRTSELVVLMAAGLVTYAGLATWLDFWPHEMPQEGKKKGT